MIDQEKLRLHQRAISLLKDAPHLPLSVRGWVISIIVRVLEGVQETGPAEAAWQYQDGYNAGMAEGAEREYQFGYNSGLAAGAEQAKIAKNKALAGTRKRFKQKLVDAIELQAERTYALAEKKFAREMAKVSARRFEEGLQKGYGDKAIAQRQSGYKEGYAAALIALREGNAAPIGARVAPESPKLEAMSWSKLPDLASRALQAIRGEFLEPVSGQVHVVRAGKGSPKWVCVAGSGKVLHDVQVECLLNLDLLVHVGARGGSPKLSLTEHAISLMQEDG